MNQKEISPIISYNDNEKITGGSYPVYEFSIVKTVLVFIIILWLLDVFKCKETFYVPFQRNAKKRMRDSYRDTPASAVYDQQYLSYPNQLSNN